LLDNSPSAKYASPPTKQKNIMEQKTNPLDNLTEKTFRLMGAIQEFDEQDPESHKEFGAALMEEYKAIVPFLQQK